MYIIIIIFIWRREHWDREWETLRSGFDLFAWYSQRMLFYPKPKLCFRGQTFSTVNQLFRLIGPQPKTLLTEFMKDQSKGNNFNRPVARTYTYPASFMAQALFWRYLAHVKESG